MSYSGTKGIPLNMDMPSSETDKTAYMRERDRRVKAGTWLSPATGAFVAVNKATGQLFKTHHEAQAFTRGRTDATTNPTTTEAA
ncbi:MAG: hypothetical protein R2761_23660 [Acidimicrobiales bacterium]